MRFGSLPIMRTAIDLEEGKGSSGEDGGGKAASYNRLKRRARIINLSIGAGLLAVLLFTGLSLVIREHLEVVAARPWVLILLYFVILATVAEALSFPVSYYSGFMLERRYDMSRESRASFLRDELKSYILGLGMGLGVVELIYWLIRQWPDGWWLMAGLFFMGIFVLLTNLAPVLLFPIFFKFEPLEEGDLKGRLIQLIQKTKIGVRGLFRMDLSRKTRAANAALAGIGNTRRIILSDTLLDNFTIEEVETVVAHELGHHVLRHIPRLIMVQSCSTLLGLFLAHKAISWGTAYFGLNGIDDIAGLPLLGLVFTFLALVLMPFANYYSRKLETDSDSYALEITGNPMAFISAMRRLASLNLAETDPHPLVVFFFYSHPPISKRIGHGEEFARKIGAG